MTQYTEGGSFQHSPLTPSCTVLAPERAAWMGQIRTGPKSTSKRHGIIVIHLPQSYYTHRLKIFFVLMSSISTLEQPSATSHYADATHAGHRSFSSGILMIMPWERHCLVVTTVLQGLEEGQAVQGEKAPLSLGL